MGESKGNKHMSQGRDQSTHNPLDFISRKFALETELTHLEPRVRIDRGPMKTQMNGILQPDLNSPVEIINIDPYVEGVDPAKFPTTKRIGKAAIDYDGDPTAYMPGDIGREKLENGGSKTTKPYGYFPDHINYLGGYVSKTAWQKKGSPDHRQSSYVDARRVPYVAMPSSYFKGQNEGRKGDFVRITNKITKKTIWAVVADSRGSNDKDIELSAAAATQLGVEFNREQGTTKNASNLALEAFRGSASGKWYE